MRKTIIDRVYIIANRAVEGEYWSNVYGWVPLMDATIFVYQDVNLPIDGRWVTLVGEERLVDLDE